MARYIYVDAEGQEQGPSTLEELLTMPDDTLVRKDGGPLRFMRLAQVPGWQAAQPSKTKRAPWSAPWSAPRSALWIALCIGARKLRGPRRPLVWLRPAQP